MTSKVVLLTGAPASGKSTEARRLASEGYQIVASDDIRAMYSPGIDSFGMPRSKQREAAVVKTMGLMTETLVRNGFNVVVDSVNVRPRMVNSVIDATIGLDAEYEVKSFWSTGLKECLRRDETRMGLGERAVGPEVIQRFFNDYSKSNWKLTEEWVYSRIPEIIPWNWSDDIDDWAWVYDIDGTLALHDGRGPYEFEKLLTDKPNFAVVETLKNNYLISGGKTILLSGRKSEFRVLTEKWLANNHIPYDYLFMRDFNDDRNDAVVKAELFNKYIRGNFNVYGVYDDRDRVVRTWRAMGLSCFQVAEGAF